MSEEELFTKRMRKATRQVHAISDALVNGKLLFALSDPNVWAEGLLVFYEIFRFLEEAVETHPESNLKRLYVDGMKRKDEFEKDLAYYLGPNWKNNYKPRQSVENYLSHLEKLQSIKPDLLIAYAYHLYMGLLSGGQILQKKMQLMNKFQFKRKNLSEGYSVTTFNNKDIKTLKAEISSRLNEMAQFWTEEEKLIMLQESKKVFILNNTIIRSVKGTTKALTFRFITFFFVGVFLMLVFLFFKNIILDFFF